MPYALANPEFEDKFWSRVHRTAHSCWEWAGARTGARYGALGKNPQRSAHRTAWSLANESEIPEGLVLHVATTRRAFGRRTFSLDG